MTSIKIPEALTVETAQHIQITTAPKTGLAKRMREWMKARTGAKPQRRFTIAEICSELGIQPGRQRERLVNALGDFVGRNELTIYDIKSPGRRSRPLVTRQYLYIHDWQAELKGTINRKIYKAMYVSHDFTVKDIQRLTGLQERDWLDKIVRQLKKDGHLQPIQRRLCAHGAGAEIIYHVVNRDKFKLEFVR